MALALVVLTVVLVLGVAAGYLVARSSTAAREPLPPEPDPALAHELRRITEEQRRLGEEQRRLNDEAVRRLLDSNRAVLEQERLRSTSELDGKKALIDQQLSSMTNELGKVGDLVRGLEADRRKSLGQLTNELQRQHEGLNTLSEHTRQLREALASSKVRGQWGERMAEDVLRLAGFLEGVNYRKQVTLDSAGRPDFTFMLPNGLVLHMDVKFPLDNYLKYTEAPTELERARAREQFLRDVRDRVKELTTRGYLDGRETVDCLLLFIPNEAVYTFVQEHDRDVLDDALRHKIVLCSPLTLYAVLAVVRQAVDNFRLEQTSNEILTLLRDFSLQWEKYAGQLDKVQQRFEQVAKEYAALMTTRHRALQRPLDKIESLRREETALVEATPTPFSLEA
jgi:DNA recombination protein RmuC